MQTHLCLSCDKSLWTKKERTYILTEERGRGKLVGGRKRRRGSFEVVAKGSSHYSMSLDR